MAFLGHPAMTGFGVILAFWSIFSGTIIALTLAAAAASKEVAAWLNETVETTRMVFWAMGLGLPLLTLVVVYLMDRRAKRAQPEDDDPEDLDYRIEHGVVWRWPAPTGGRNRPVGWNPKCPNHMITVDVAYYHDDEDEKGPFQIMFECRGEDFRSAHQIEGPLAQELREGDLWIDTFDRIRGKELLNK